MCENWDPRRFRMTCGQQSPPPPLHEKQCKTSCVMLYFDKKPAGLQFEGCWETISGYVRLNCAPFLFAQQNPTAIVLSEIGHSEFWTKRGRTQAEGRHVSAETTVQQSGECRSICTNHTQPVNKPSQKYILLASTPHELLSLDTMVSLCSDCLCCHYQD